MLAALGIAAPRVRAVPRVGAATAIWRAAYFANMDLTGAPALTRDEGDAIDEWYDGVTSPAPGVPANGFSVLWTNTEALDRGGLYRFSVIADDGITVLVDGQPVIDEWFDKSATSYDAELRLAAGDHALAVEYYHHFGTGRARLLIELIEADTPTPSPAPSPVTATPTPTATVTSPATPTARVPTVEPSPTVAAAHHEPVASITPVRTATATGTAAPTLTATPGSSARPRIECKWELPDMDSAAPGFQYRPRHESDHAGHGAAVTEAHDDDVIAGPDRDGDHDDGFQPPCDASPHGAPGQPGGVHHAIQVAPNPGDEPEARRVELWLAASHPEGVAVIASVFWVVYIPDGSQLAVVPGERLAARYCDGLGRGEGSPGSMFEAAAQTGQLSSSAIDDEHEGVHARCRDERDGVYRGEFSVSINEPCGEYRVTAVAVSTGGAVAQLSNYIDVLCVFALKIDFGSIDWGTITPGTRGVVAGDTRFRPRADVAPTVMNAGNDGMGLRLRFSALGSTPGPRIDEFDSCFGRTEATMQCIDPIAAGVPASFDVAPARVLCGNETGRVDFAIHPASGLAPGIYRGMLSLVGFHVGGECAGNRHLP